MACPVSETDASYRQPRFFMNPLFLTSRTAGHAAQCPNSAGLNSATALYSAGEIAWYDWNYL